MRTDRLTLAELWDIARWPGAVCLAGLFLHRVYPHHWYFASTVAMFADALAVGAVIAITLEAFLSHVLIQRTAESLSERLVGAGLPSDLQAVIGGIVHRTVIVQDQASARFAIRLDPADSARVIVAITRRYRVWNYSRGVTEYRPSLAEEHYHQPRFVSLECFRGTALYCHLQEHELVVEEKPGSHSKIVHGKSVLLNPVERDKSGDSFTVVWNMEITVPCDYSDVIAFGNPTVGCFEIELASKPDGFEFEATAEPTMSSAEGGTIWRYHRAFLPEQHLRVWWRPKE
jgi:hypothetical protein